MTYLPYSGVNIHYEIAGMGRPLLYLHGWNGSIKSFKDNLSHTLVNDHQLIMVDLPGFGKSDYLPLTFAVVSKIIEQILTEHDIDRVRIVGFCMGGAFALDFSIRYPHRLHSLVLMETSFQFPWIMYPILLPGIGEKILRFFLFTPTGVHLTKQFLLLSAHHYKENFYAQFQSADLKISRAYAKMLFSYSRAGHEERISRIQAQTQIIIGKHTSWSIRTSAQKLKRLIKNSELLILEKCRHFPIEENRSELLQNLQTDMYPHSLQKRPELELQLLSS